MSAPYREPPPIPPDPYSAVWTKLRRRQLALRALAVCFFSFVVPTVAMSLVPESLHVTGVALGLVIAVPASLVALSLLPPFQCPRCGESFSLSVAAELGRSRHCCHCDLAVGARAGRSLRETNFPPLGPRRMPLARSSTSLALTLVAAFLGYHSVRAAPWVATTVIALSIATIATTLFAQLMGSRAFPRALLIPIAALALSSAVAGGANRLDARAARLRCVSALASAPLRARP